MERSVQLVLQRSIFRTSTVRYIWDDSTCFLHSFFSLYLSLVDIFLHREIFFSDIYNLQDFLGARNRFDTHLELQLQFHAFLSLVFSKIKTAMVPRLFFSLQLYLLFSFVNKLRRILKAFQDGCFLAVWHRVAGGG